MCSTRNGWLPVESTGRVYSRSVQRLRSMPAAYPSVATATATVPVSNLAAVLTLVETTVIRMAELKARLRLDLTTAMKARETATVAVLRMALAAVTNEEVAGAAARELTDAEVQKVLAREVRKRKEAAEAFAGAGRAEQAEAERQEGEILQRYLPAQLDETELRSLVDEAVAEVAQALGERPGQRQMGQVMKAANARVTGRAEGARVATLVKAALTD